MTLNAAAPNRVRPTRITIPASDGWALSLQVLDPAEPNSGSPVLVVFPALAVASGIYIRMALSLVRKGYKLVLVDPRGAGSSGPLPSATVDYSIARHLECDWPAVVRWVRGRYPGVPLVLVGHSLGGQIGAIYAGQHPGTIDALILLNVPFVWYRNWPFPLRWVLWAIYWSVSIAAGFFGYFPADRFGLGQPVSRKVTREWARWGLSGTLNTETAAHLETFLAQVTGPVLAISFSDDWFHGPASAVSDFARRLTHSKLTRWHLSPSDLEVSALGHFRYLRNAPVLWERIHLWLDLQF